MAELELGNSFPADRKFGTVSQSNPPLARPLEPGDRLCVISPSGPLREFSAFDKGVQIWRDRGYEVSLSPGFDQKWGYLAGSDRHRRQQLQAALQDETCRGILCARGGYGGARLLEGWATSPDAHPALQPIQPKWLIGFSDITSLLWGLPPTWTTGVHAPVLTTLAAEPDWSLKRLLDWVEGRELGPLQGTGWCSGIAQGKLLPGNLTVATHLLGTPLQPILDGVILALEDVSEAPYRLDRMLTQWRLMGALDKVRGIALGRFSQCENAPEPGEGAVKTAARRTKPAYAGYQTDQSAKADYSLRHGFASDQLAANSFAQAALGPDNTLDLNQMLRDRLGDLGIPIVAELPFGHDGPNATLPVGQWVELDGDRGSLSWTSSPNAP